MDELVAKSTRAPPVPDGARDDVRAARPAARRDRRLRGDGVHGRAAAARDRRASRARRETARCRRHGAPQRLRLTAGRRGGRNGRALALSRVLAGFVFGVSPLDPATYVGAVAVLAAVAGLSAYWPSRTGVRAWIRSWCCATNEAMARASRRKVAIKTLPTASRRSTPAQQAEHRSLRGSKSLREFVTVLSIPRPFDRKNAHNALAWREAVNLRIPSGEQESATMSFRIALAALLLGFTVACGSSYRLHRRRRRRRRHRRQAAPRCRLSPVRLRWPRLPMHPIRSPSRSAARSRGPTMTPRLTRPAATAVRGIHGPIAPGGTFSRTFSSAGTFPYRCTLHPGMVGTVTVQ